MSDEDLAELRAHWNRFAAMFEAEMEHTTVLLARSVMAHLRLGTAKAALEVGAGAGAGARAMLEDLAPEARLVVSDLSPAMVELARGKLPDRAEVVEADACDLPFEDEEFDRLLCNLNLMLVPDPDAALAQAARVLRPGARAGWSVWGRRERSAMFTLPPRAAERVGLTLPEIKRSNFHLGDRQETIERVRGHGFKNILGWYQALMRDIPNGMAYAQVVLKTPRWEKYLEGVDPEQVEALRVELARLAQEHLASGQAIGLEALVIIAERA